MSDLAMVIQSVEKEVYGEAKADPTKEAIKELKHELFEQTNLMEDVLDKLDKADLILGHWENEYSFYENPDPRAAIEWGSKVPSQNQDPEKVKRHGEQSYKWFLEYNTIFQLIRIVSDYVYESRQLLQKAIKGEEAKA